SSVGSVLNGITTYSLNDETIGFLVSKRGLYSVHAHLITNSDNAGDFVDTVFYITQSPTRGGDTTGANGLYGRQLNDPGASFGGNNVTLSGILLMDAGDSCESHFGGVAIGNHINGHSFHIYRICDIPPEML